LGNVPGVDCMVIRSEIVLACAGAMGLGAPAARAEDWPQWGRDASRNMVSDEIGLPVSFSPGKTTPDGSAVDMSTTRNVRWLARLGTHTYGNPVVAAGKVIVGTNDASLNVAIGVSCHRGPVFACGFVVATAGLKLSILHFWNGLGPGIRIRFR